MTAAISLQRLKRRALSLGMVKAFDQAMQFLLPIVLVRCLEPATFGEYRLLWLAVGSLLGVATLNMAGTLFYFVPRSEPLRKRLYVHQTMLYLAATGVVSALLIGLFNPLPGYGVLAPVFIAVWIGALLIEYLPTIDERIRWAAGVTVALSIARFLLVAAGAWLSGDMAVILWLLIATATLKLAILFYYVHRHHGLGRPWFDRETFSGQFRHGAPIGVSAALYGLRGYVDQWVAASLFALHSFAAFSLAAIFGQVVNLFRTSVLEAFLPSMSRMHAAGDLPAMMDMNARANVLVAGFLYPLLAFTFVYAEDLVTLVYTSSYLEAAPVMRVYALGAVLLSLEVGSLLLMLRQGPYAVAVNAIALALTGAASLAGALYFGLTGAACGSVLALAFDRVMTLRRIGRAAGIPLAKLQDWRGLASIALVAALGGALAWGVTHVFLAHAVPLVRIAAGAVVVAAVYSLFMLRRGAAK